MHQRPTVTKLGLQWVSSCNQHVERVPNEREIRPPFNLSTTPGLGSLISSASSPDDAPPRSGVRRRVSCCRCGLLVVAIIERLGGGAYLEQTDRPNLDFLKQPTVEKKCSRDSSGFWRHPGRRNLPKFHRVARSAVIAQPGHPVC
jgi:hypothetical protein